MLLGVLKVAQIAQQGPPCSGQDRSLGYSIILVVYHSIIHVDLLLLYCFGARLLY